ncbi:MAG TPA: hypothetical protein VEY12_03470 [Thermoplasmata archaeon]|nr:hypothetical protein [Thermoplasmata archaeon]
MVVVGGLAVALGTVVTGNTLWDIGVVFGGLYTGSMPPAVFQRLLEEVGTLTAIGAVLSAAGFLLVFVGVAIAFRDPCRAPRRITRRTFAILVLGGSLVAAGFVAFGVFSLYSNSSQPLLVGYQVLYSLDLAGRIVEAVGFFVAFAGLAHAIRR